MMSQPQVGSASARRTKWRCAIATISAGSSTSAVSASTASAWRSVRSRRTAATIASLSAKWLSKEPKPTSAASVISWMRVASMP
jgi:hypothetical protein